MTCREYIENYDYIIEARNMLYERRYMGGTPMKYPGGKAYGSFAIF